MTRPLRLAVFALGVAGVLLLLVLPAGRELPPFGGSLHPLRDLAVAGAVRHVTANAVSSVNFDQRAFDTLGEELILLASVTGVSVLLRPREDEEEREPAPAGEVLAPVRLLTYLMLPVALLIGLDVVVHGHVTPGGGFQGGVVLATGIHLLYVGGSYGALQRLRPLGLFTVGEAVGEAGYLVLGLAATLTGAAFLANVLPFGTFGDLLSAGTVEPLSIAVGLEVGSGVVIVLGDFLRQDLVIEEDA